MANINQNINFSTAARNVIQKAYENSCYTLPELAKRSKIQYSQLAFYLKGRNDIRVGDYISLCIVLNIDIRQLEF